MFTILLIFLAFLAILYFFGDRFIGPDITWTDIIIYSLGAVIVSTFLLAFLSSTLNLGTCDVQISTQRLHSLRQTTQLTGSFFFGSGGFDVQPHYEFIVETASTPDDATYQVYTVIPNGNTSVYFKVVPGLTSPAVEVVDYVTDINWVFSSCNDRAYIFNVPVGTDLFNLNFHPQQRENEETAEEAIQG